MAGRLRFALTSDHPRQVKDLRQARYATLDAVLDDRPYVSSRTTPSRPVAMVRPGCLATALESNEVTVSILFYY
jgi:hypothetical protein